MTVPLISALPTVPSYDNTNFESLAPAFLSFLKNTFQAEMNAAIAAINNYDYGAAVNISKVVGLTAGRIPYGAGTGALGSSAKLTYTAASDTLAVGGLLDIGTLEVLRSNASQLYAKAPAAFTRGDGTNLFVPNVTAARCGMGIGSNGYSGYSNISSSWSMYLKARPTDANSWVRKAFDYVGAGSGPSHLAHSPYGLIFVADGTYNNGTSDPGVDGADERIVARLDARGCLYLGDLPSTTVPTAAKKLEVRDATGAQARLVHSSGNYTDFQTDGDGNLTIAPSGGGALSVTVPIKPPSYTVATAPSASTAGAGAMIYVTDDVGGAVIAFSDGTNWRRVTDRATVSTT